MRKWFLSAVIFFVSIAAHATSFAIEQVTPSLDQVLSLDVKGVEVKEFLRILSLKSGYTIVPSRNIAARITLLVSEVTLKDILDVSAVAYDLAYEVEDDIITVLSAAEYEALYGHVFNEKRKFKSVKLQFADPASVVAVLNELKSDIGKVILDKDSGTLLLVDVPSKLTIMQQAIEEVDQALTTIIYDLNYMESITLKDHLATLLTPGVGRVIIDERNNKAIVYDLPERIAKIAKLLPVFDEKSREVAIEATILQLTPTARVQTGIQWEKVFANHDDLRLTGTFPVSPTLSSSGAISMGTLSDDRYTAVLEFLREYGNAKVLSSPRIVVLNNQEAKILVGTREVYVTQSLSQAKTTVTSESIEFIDVGVKLSVTPTINNEGFITMKIKPEVSSVRAEPFTTPSGTEVPIVDTSEAETVVKVKDGTMIMIAGLTKEEKSDATSGIPVLSQLPVVGALFGTRDKEHDIAQILVFITPRIIEGDRDYGKEPVSANRYEGVKRNVWKELKPNAQ